MPTQIESVFLVGSSQFFAVFFLKMCRSFLRTIVKIENVVEVFDGNVLSFDNICQSGTKHSNRYPCENRNPVCLVTTGTEQKLTISQYVCAFLSHQAVKQIVWKREIYLDLGISVVNLCRVRNECAQKNKPGSSKVPNFYEDKPNPEKNTHTEERDRNGQMKNMHRNSQICSIFEVFQIKISVFKVGEIGFELFLLSNESIHETLV